MKTIVTSPGIDQVRIIPLDLLDASPNNPRKTLDETSLAELAASIRSIGISQPLIVRAEPLEDGLIEERYEIVAGHRRSEAASLAGLFDVPCIVRKLTDAEADELALIDNLQRVDVPALEEAEAFGKLLDLHGTAAAVAARVGKEVAHVAKRLALRSLSTWQCDALRERLITVDHALLLARLGVEEQDAALKWCLDRNVGSKTSVDKVIAERQKCRGEEKKRGWHWEPETPQRLKEHIEQSSGRKLARAPWSLDDEDLDREAGACSTCPSNTKANTSLFGDLAIEAATCAHGACFERKRAAFVRIRLRTATKDETVPVRLSWKQTATPPRFENVDLCKCAAGKNCKTGTGCRGVAKTDQVFKARQWIEAKKGSCANIRPGVTVDWSDANNRGYVGREEKLRKPGELIAVCVAAGCKAHKKEWEKAKHENTNSSERVDPAEQKAIAAARAHLEKVETEVRLAVLRAILAKLDAAKALRLLLDDDLEAPQLRAKVFKWFPKISGVELDAFALLWSQNVRDVEPNDYWLIQPGGVERDRSALWKMAKSVGVDADAATVKYFDEAGIADASRPLLPKTATKKPASKPAAKKAAKKAAKAKLAKPAKKGGGK